MIIQCLKPFDPVAKAQCEAETFAGAYASRVRTEFQSLDQTQNTAPFLEAVRLCAIAKPTWEEIFLLELLSFRLMSLEDLEAKKTIIREKFSQTTRSESPDTIDPIDRLNSSLERAKDLLGGDIAKFSADFLKIASGTTSPKDQSYMESLRAELMAKVAEMQWSFRKTIEREKAYAKLRIATAILGASLVAFLLGIYQFKEHDVIAWCAAFGTLGALTSVLRRLYLGAIKESDGSYTSTVMLSTGSSSVTFSHYGFSGVASELNQVDAESITPQIHHQDILEYTLGKARAFWEKRAADVADLLRLGHAGVATFPDRPYLHWRFTYQDGRDSGERKNAETFMEACEKLYAMFGKFATASGERFYKANDASDFQDIRPTLTDIISVEGKMEDRIGAWQWAARKGSLYSNPSGEPIPDYDPSSFKNDASRFPSLERSDVKKTLVYQFMKAAAVHRDYVLNELLPKHGLEVVLP